MLIKTFILLLISATKKRSSLKISFASLFDLLCLSSLCKLLLQPAKDALHGSHHVPFHVCHLIEDPLKVTKAGKRIVNVVLRWHLRATVLSAMSSSSVRWAIRVSIVVKIGKEILGKSVIESERVGEWILVESIHLEVIRISSSVRPSRCVFCVSKVVKAGKGLESDVENIIKRSGAKEFPENFFRAAEDMRRKRFEVRRKFPIFPSRTSRKTFLAISIVNFTFILVGQNLICFRNELESFLCRLFVVGIFVRVPSQRLPSITFPYVVLCRRFWNPQYFIVFVGHCGKQLRHKIHIQLGITSDNCKQNPRQISFYPPASSSTSAQIFMTSLSLVP